MYLSEWTSYDLTFLLRTWALPLRSTLPPISERYSVTFLSALQAPNSGWDNRARTCDKRINSPLLYQLSYIPKLASLAGFEPATLCLEGRCSILLNYSEKCY